MTNLLSIIADVAAEMVGFRETSQNRAPWLPQIWKATWYKDGMDNLEPYCAAAVCYWIQEADHRSTDIKLRIPPVNPSCSGLLNDFYKPDFGAMIFDWVVRKPLLHPRRGDIVFSMPHFSHVGVVSSDEPFEQDGEYSIETIEANTNIAGSREGDGVLKRVRPISLCGKFVRLPVVAKAVEDLDLLSPTKRVVLT
jgi:hypothetical protein